jgi:hypothetical protein
LLYRRAGERNFTLRLSGTAGVILPAAESSSTPPGARLNDI